MNCREFERRCNARLDVRDAPPSRLDPALDAHEAVCPSCRALGAAYRLLAQAVDSRARSPVPSAPDGFTDRVLAAVEADRMPSVRRRQGWTLARRWLPLAAAAALLATTGIGLRAWRSGLDADRPPVVATDGAVPPADPRDLPKALADATSATLSLAWEASVPAARVGSEVLEDAGFPDPPPGLAGLPVPSVPAAEVWQEVGDRVNAGVVPLSGSARSAFSFLLGTRAREAGGGLPPAPSRPPRGA